MSQELIFASISVFIYYVGFVPYIYHAFHGRVVPHPFSWTIWFIFASVNLYIIFEVNGITWSFASLSMRTLALLIGLSCGWWMIRKISISKFDYLSLLLAILIIIFIKFYGLSEAVIAMILVDMTIMLPTLKKIWLDPRTEDAFAWFTTALSQACLLISLPFFTFENSTFWFYAICANISVGIFIKLRRRYLQKRLLYKVLSFFAFRWRLW